MGKKAYGLKAITIGDIAVDGGMGTTLTEIFGETVLGTAVLESTEPTIENVMCEESSDPVESLTTADPVFTLKASTYNVSNVTMKALFGGTISGAGGVATVGTIVPGTGYVNGTYSNVPLTGGTGVDATANITVASGAITVVTIVNKGKGYTVADSLSALASDLGGTGSGFTVPVATLSTGPETWKAPADGVIPTIEKSVRAESKTGIKFNFVRMKLTASLGVTFDKTRLGQINWTGTRLAPTKTGTPPMDIDFG